MRAEEGEESIAELAEDAEQAAQRLETVGNLTGKRVVILVTDGVERRELQEPREAVEAAGMSADLLSLDTGSIDMRDHDLAPAGDVHVDRVVSDATPDEFDALVIPGGTVNVDKLRSNGDAVKFVRDFATSGKPAGVICHGPWTLIEADVVNHRTLTSFPSLRTDLHNAGAIVVDREVVVDGNLITSRSPEDLPAFCSTVIVAIADAQWYCSRADETSQEGHNNGGG